jgi:endonuclease/exonuclease/phosphatase family metal-dependent hydrolase
MRCMTYNIWNYTRPWPTRRAMIAAIIERYRPDVVALQETRHDWRFERGKGQGEQIASLTGYHATSVVAQVYVPVLRIDEGLTILSRDAPIRVMQKRLTMHSREREDENQRVCLGVALHTGGTEFHVYNSHFSLSESARVTNAVEVSRFIAEESGGIPSVLMGDLNAFPDTEPIRFLLGEIEVAGGTGDFVDCWKSEHADDPGFTYASWEPDHTVDYVLGRNLPGHIIAAEIVGREGHDGVFPSDHAGIVVDLDM